MNPKVLPQEAWTVVRMLEGAGLLEPWILAGGTGLALQLGHRISIDLDLFAVEPPPLPVLRATLAGLGKLDVQAEDASTLHVLLNGVRLSFLKSEVPFLFPPVDYRGLRVADARDIAAMKIVAVGGRGSRKDFVDLYAFLEAGGDFQDLIEVLRQRYANTSFNEMHLLKSLVFFDDAEQEPMPRMIHQVDWKDIRSRLEIEARRWAP